MIYYAQLQIKLVLDIGLNMLDPKLLKLFESIPQDSLLKML